ncbi:UNVERIFIED_CONTAM: hypothetical protein HDU68_009572 [Siphonaria sp. JEL0065]|nr:hypothetical protein HDU68_009572 [Siphonaria sp. JEL0065]
MCYDLFDLTTLEYTEIAYVARTAYMGLNGGLEHHARCRIRGNNNVSAKIMRKSVICAPGMTYKIADEYSAELTQPLIPTEEEYLVHDAYKVKVVIKEVRYDKWTLAMKMYLPTNTYNYIIYHPLLKVVVDRNYANDIGTSAIPVADIRVAPETDHIFMIKIDGTLFNGRLLVSNLSPILASVLVILHASELNVSLPESWYSLILYRITVTTRQSYYVELVLVTLTNNV